MSPEETRGNHLMHRPTLEATMKDRERYLNANALLGERYTPTYKYASDFVILAKNHLMLLDRIKADSFKDQTKLVVVVDGKEVPVDTPRGWDTIEILQDLTAFLRQKAKIENCPTPFADWDKLTNESKPIMDRVYNLDPERVEDLSRQVVGVYGELVRMRERDLHRARLFGVTDNGEYQADWESCAHRLRRDSAILEKVRKAVQSLRGHAEMLPHTSDRYAEGVTNTIQAIASDLEGLLNP